MAARPHCERLSHCKRLFQAGLVCLAAVHWATGPLPRVAAQDELPITPIVQVMATPRDQARLRRPVRIRGTVSLIADGISSRPLHDDARASFCVEDETAGIWIRSGHALAQEIFRGNEDDLVQLRYGMDIELDGQIDQGAFAPVILPTRIKILGKSSLPEAPRASNRRLLNGADELRRVRANGVVQSVADESDTCWSLRVETGVGHFLTRVPKEPAFSPDRLLDAEVEIIGLTAVAWNWRSEFVCPRIIVRRREDFRIRKPASVDPFEVEKVSIESLDGYSVNGRPRHRRRVEGVVTYYDQQVSLFIQQDEIGIHVEVNEPVDVQVGDRVEVSGFIDNSRYLAGIHGAAVRSIGRGQPVSPFPLKIEQIFASHMGFERSGPLVASSCDGRLIELSGRLLDFQIGLPSKPHRLQLDCGDSIVTAFLEGKAPNLQPGSELAVVGIAKLDFSRPLKAAVLTHPTRVDLLLRNADDITVVGRSSWWTPRRMFTGLLAASGIAAAAFFWAFTLQKSLKRQTELIATEMRKRRDVALEFQAAIGERTRLAANLHDTLLQNLAGIGYQLEACEPCDEQGRDEIPSHLRLAGQMVQHCQDDLRNTVWTLHCLPLSEGTFADSVQQVVRRVGMGRDTKISVKCADPFPPLADFIAGNLLLVIQESVQNAIHHSQADRIDVELGVTSCADNASIMIGDNGIGFDVDRPRSSADGHFGLEGMRRRIERLGGNLAIESEHGKGTVVRADIPLREFDPKLI